MNLCKNAVLYAWGGAQEGLCVVVLSISGRIMRHATIVNARLCKNAWKIDLVGISCVLLRAGGMLYTPRQLNLQITNI